jgi:hypothetical protein
MNDDSRLSVECQEEEEEEEGDEKRERKCTALKDHRQRPPSSRKVTHRVFFPKHSMSIRFHGQTDGEALRLTAGIGVGGGLKGWEWRSGLRIAGCQAFCGFSIFQQDDACTTLGLEC